MFHRSPPPTPDATSKPLLIGYFPQKTEPRPDFLKAEGVIEICGVAGCISAPPTDWIDPWQHNEMWAYATPSLAASIAQEQDRLAYEIYAYKLDSATFRRLRRG